MRRKLLRNSLWLTVLAVAMIACTTEPPLPYVGPHDVFRDAEGNADTVFYTVPKFVFTNQDGKEVTHHDYEGKVYVTDFFFTTCPSICPIMSSQMARLQGLLKQEGMWGDVMLLSHTVDPEQDTLPALKAFAEDLGADFTYWNFVRGSADATYKHAEQGYFMTAFPSDTAAGGFFHTDQFALIDRDRHIRGYYDGTSTPEVDRLFRDIKRLLKED